MRGLTGKDAGREETGAQEAQMQEGLGTEYTGERAVWGKAASDTFGGESGTGRLGGAFVLLQ
ncbi:MAG: hypothetical protein ACLSS9_04175 [Acutalibacteraceae bacterium]